MSLLCLHCGAESESTPDLKACPACGDNAHIPADLDDAVDIHITNHELRMLTMWADNWAGYIEERHPGSKRALRIILDRVAPQTGVALTISQEIADVRAAFPESGVKVYNARGEEIDL